MTLVAPNLNALVADRPEHLAHHFAAASPQFDAAKVVEWKAEKERRHEENRVAHEAELAQAKAELFATRL